MFRIMNESTLMNNLAMHGMYTSNQRPQSVHPAHPNSHHQVHRHPIHQQSLIRPHPNRQNQPPPKFQMTSQTFNRNSQIPNHKNVLLWNVGKLDFLNRTRNDAFSFDVLSLSHCPLLVFKLTSDDVVNWLGRSCSVDIQSRYAQRIQYHANGSN